MPPEQLVYEVESAVCTRVAGELGGVSPLVHLGWSLAQTSGEVDHYLGLVECIVLPVPELQFRWRLVGEREHLT